MKDPHALLAKLIGNVDKIQGNVMKLEEENEELKKAIQTIYKHQIKKHKEYEERIKNCETYHKC